MRHEAYSRTFMEKYSSGRRGAPAKGVGRVTGAEVQIFSSPPRKTQIELVRFGLFFLSENQRSNFCSWLCHE